MNRLNDIFRIYKIEFFGIDNPWKLNFFKKMMTYNYNDSTPIKWTEDKMIKT
jgi:hypothetical protein